MRKSWGESGFEWARGPAGNDACGFTLIELLTSVAIITVLMAAVFQFLAFSQKRYRGDQLLAERNQGARGALELLTLELQQAGNNPNFSPHKSLTAAVAPTGGIVDIPVNNTTGIFYGNLVEIGPSAADPNRETVEVKGDATHRITATSFPAIIAMSHASGQPVLSKSLPFPNGILYSAPAAGSDQTVAVDSVRFFGDIEGNGTVHYVEYSLVDTTETSTIKCQTSAGPPPTYADCHKYEFRRFSTPILNPNIPASKAASGGQTSPLADNILGFPDSGTTQCGTVASGGVAGVPCNPDGKPIIRLNYDTFGNLTYGFTTYVRSVEADLTLQTVDKDPEVNDFRTIRMRSRIVPTNINYAWGITLLGGSPELPFMPRDPDGHTLPLP
jgi:prepilin-type N-terminal cleavage/methylation domain-containing protein